MKTILFLITLALIQSKCVYPGTCTPPNTKYKLLQPTIPRIQWGTSGGFCGALSMQTGFLRYGAYLSQDIIRKNAPYGGGGHGDKELGYEIIPTNIGKALENLKFNYTQWDYKH